MGSINPRFSIDEAASNDILQICAIERSATAKFAQIPQLGHLVDGDVLSESKVQSWLDKGRIFVARDTLEREKAAGFAATHDMDGRPFLAEISVLSDYHRQGIGGMLLDAIKDYARGSAAGRGGSARVTLTTYPDVPWNGPWYRKYGFVEVLPENLGPDHIAKMTLDEDERGLVQPGYRRCCMAWEEVTVGASK